jgi:hypothetical protein
MFFWRPFLSRSRYLILLLTIFSFLIINSQSTVLADPDTVIVSPNDLNNWTLRRESPRP